MRGSKGIALIAVIALILFAAIIILGISSFVSNSIALNAGRAYMEGAFAAAQAGIYASLYDYTADGFWVKQTADVTVMNNVSYKAGKDADFLLIDSDDPRTAKSGSTKNCLLCNIPLSNINQTQPIIVNQMKVEWYNFGGNLEKITLGSTNPNNWSGTAASGQVLTLTRQFTLDAQEPFSNKNDNTWIFSDTIPNNATIIVTFYFMDGSNRKAYLMNNGRSGNKEFSITATGKVHGASDWKRTIRATYDIGVSKFTSWQETGDHI